MNLFRLPCFGKQSSFYSYFMCVIFVMFWLACIMLVTIVNWIDFKYPLCLLMGDNYNRGVGECHNSSKGYILCIIAIKSMKIFGQKRPLSFTHLYLHVFLDPYNLFSISNHWKFCIHTCIKVKYFFCFYIFIHVQGTCTRYIFCFYIFIHTQGICTRYTRHVQVYLLWIYLCVFPYFLFLFLISLETLFPHMHECQTQFFFFFHICARLLH